MTDRKPRRQQIIVIDLGSRVTKSACFRREELTEGDEPGVVLTSYACIDAPAAEKRQSREAWQDHFQAVVSALGVQSNQAIIILSSDESRLYHVDLPAVGVTELRKIVRLNPKGFFQEDLPNYLFDCFILPTFQAPKPAEPPVEADGDNGEGKDGIPPTKPSAGASAGGPGRSKNKVRALVGAANAQLVENLRVAATASGLAVEQIAVGQICPINAFQSMPKSFQRDAVALVDIGFRTSTITILLHGVPVLSRVVNIGGDRFTSGLAEAMNISYSVAEGIKQVMPEKVRGKLQSLIAPLAQELRASIDFFEHQYEKTVSEVFVSGSSARSNLVIHVLETETFIPCKTWNPIQKLTVELPSDQASDLAKAAPQLVDAVGAAMAWFNPELVQLNLMAEELEAIEMRRRDPIRRGMWIVGGIVLVLIACVAWQQFRFWQLDQRLSQREAQLRSLESISSEVTQYSRQARQVERAIERLHTLTTNRFLWASALNALQFCVVDQVQVTRLKLDRTVKITLGTKTVTNANNRITLGKPDTANEKIVLSIQAKDFGNPPLADEFIETIASYGYFTSNLRPRDSIRLVERSARQVDPLEPDRNFILFTIECYYSERQFKGE